MAGALLFSNDFPVNTLTHLCTEDCNCRAYCKLRRSEIAKINVFILDPKPKKNEIKREKKDKISRVFSMPDGGIYPSIYVFT